MTEILSISGRSTNTALAVRLGQSLFAIPIAAVEEVLPALPVEPIPECPPFVRGVVFVRGHLIPVLEAAERLRLPGYMRPLEPHIVCLRVRERLVGVEFDEALDLINLDAGVKLAADQFQLGQGCLTGVVDLDGQIIRLLNPDKLVALDDWSFPGHVSSEKD